MTWRPPVIALPRPRLSVADILVFAAAGAVLYWLLSFAPAALRRPHPSIEIDLRPGALPGYALLSFLRMVAAYLLSLLFTLVVGFAAARNKRSERILIPLMDILQSIPVLSFLPAVLLAMIAVFPRETLGLEVGSIILIFTGMVWNMAFSLYHSLLTIPAELVEAARMLRLNWWQRLTSLELPASAIGLVWNSMMSWAGGWFFLIACESFTLVNRSFTLPGLGSYLAAASGKGDLRAILLGLGTLVALIVTLDQLVWRPLIVWAEKFKIELTEDPAPPHSWMLDALRRSRLFSVAGQALRAPLAEALDSAFRRVETTAQGIGLMRYAPRVLGACGVVLALAAVGGVLIGSFALARMLVTLPASAWSHVLVGAAATSARVAVAMAAALAWAIPAGVFIGLRPRVARIAQPLAEIAASVPATALFPVLLLILIRLNGGLNVASILLMLLGTQWYVLFNVIAGATAIPRDLQESAALLKLRGGLRWQTLWLPAIFPYLVTGGITAQGGAWNASIVSEYVTFGGHTYQTTGLGALIAASQGGDYSLLAASTLTMSAIVVLLNRFGWRRAMRAAEDRYHL
jgi:NitT/TauT family transport system permease protein